MKNTGLNSIPSVKGQIFNLTINLVFIAIFYVFLGGLLSWCMWRVFPEFNEEWEKKSNMFQLLDVSAEISIIVIIAFWTTYLVHSFIPVLPVSQSLEGYLESFGGQMVFVYAVFVFLDTLDDKLKHVFHDFFGTHS
jgi:heme/copper-type cytochrome/quinol oxidase subunit 2